jgi:GntR family transcriptional regulator/MocR family aminotransferase
LFDILLSDKDSCPLYMQLYQYIRQLIQTGVLNDGTKLPSIRSVQLQLHISKTTVESAYQLLMAEGYVVGKPRSGFVVVQPLTEGPPLKPIMDFSGDTHTEDPVTEAFIDFSLLDVDRDSFPNKAWRSALTEAVSRYSSTLHQYGDPKGEIALRRSIAQYLRTSRGVDCVPDQIIIGSGISYSFYLLSKLIGASGAIAIEEDSIAQVRQTITQHGFRIMPLPLFDETRMLDIEAEGIQAMYVTPSHRPTGKILTYAMKQQLLHWAAANQVFVIEDDYDGEFRYRGKSVPSLQGFDQQGVIIYIGTFSKAFTPALRMNYMVLPEQLLRRLRSMAYILSCPSRIDQLAMSIFMAKGHWYRHIKKIRKMYRMKHDFMVRLIERYLSSSVVIEAEGAGLHIEVSVREHYDVNTLIQLASRSGIRLYDSQGSRIFLGFGGLTLQEIERGILQLKKAWS